MDALFCFVVLTVVEIVVTVNIMNHGPSQKNFVHDYSIEQPWCDSATVGDRTYTRCWYAAEVMPTGEKGK